ncbi:MAG: glycosyltransferase, partial [Alphaproteobacteria bacterium]|nr:glycosyltransferase [Alphaproteobacteria bacterium]
EGAALRLLRHERPRGQTAALVAGARAAQGGVLAFIDGDGQNPPGELARLLSVYEAFPADQRVGLLLVGERRMRRDALSRRLASRLANRVRSAVLGDGVADSGSGLKVCRRDDLLRLPLFDHAHRYLPALFRAAGGRTISVPVAHRPRREGRSHYGILDRAWEGLIDLPGVLWLVRRSLRDRAREIE